MKNQILNIGKALNRAEQKQILGGFGPSTKAPELCAGGGSFKACSSNDDCCGDESCQNGYVWVDDNGDYSNTNGNGGTAQYGSYCIP